VSRRRWHNAGDSGARNARVGADQPVELLLCQRHGFDAGQRDGICGARPSVQGCDLAEDVARIGMLEGEKPPVEREDRKANASLRHQIDIAPDITAPEDGLAGLECRPAHLLGHSHAVVALDRAEQRRLAQQGRHQRAAVCRRGACPAESHRRRGSGLCGMHWLTCAGEGV
jgi:hypothetical protein